MAGTSSSVLTPSLAAQHKYEVDLYGAGHLHNYERSYPVYNGTVTGKSYDKPTATVHIVAGMAGDNEGLSER